MRFARARLATLAVALVAPVVASAQRISTPPVIQTFAGCGFNVCAMFTTFTRDVDNNVRPPYGSFRYTFEMWANVDPVTNKAPIVDLSSPFGFTGAILVVDDPSWNDPHFSADGTQGCWITGYFPPVFPATGYHCIDGTFGYPIQLIPGSRPTGATLHLNTATGDVAFALTETPEPSTIVLTATGLLTVVGIGARRRRTA